MLSLHRIADPSDHSIAQQRRRFFIGARSNVCVVFVKILGAVDASPADMVGLDFFSKGITCATVRRSRHAFLDDETA